MTIAELHAQLTEHCNHGFGGAKVFRQSTSGVLLEDIHPVMLKVMTLSKAAEPVSDDDFVMSDWLAQKNELAHGETFLMLE